MTDAAPVLSVVVPMRNEGPNVAALLAEIGAALADLPHEAVCVDDGSTDDTAARLAEAAAASRPGARVRWLRHAASCGQSAGIVTGVRAARGAWIATIDGDGQNDPADIPGLLARAQRENAGAGPAGRVMVVGWRTRRQDSWIKRRSSRIANAVRGRLLGDDTPDTGCGLKVLPRALFLDLPAFDHMHRFLPALVIRSGGRVVSESVNHRPRLQGVSNYGTLDRLAVGIVDLAGVAWLQRRWRRPVVEGAPEAPAGPDGDGAGIAPPADPMTGGTATGPVAVGLATGPATIGMATGPVAGGMATGPVAGGMATGPVAGGMATGPVAGGLGSASGGTTAPDAPAGRARSVTRPRRARRRRRQAPPPRRNAIPGAVGRMALLALGLGVAGWLLRALADAPGTELVDRFVRGQGLTGEAVFVLAGAAVTAAGVPRQALAFLGGYAFGALGGGALALLAQALGCVLCFGWARLVGRGWATRLMRGRFGRRVEPLHDALTEKPFGATLALRLLPIGNNLALNLLGGLSGVAVLPFLAASVIGYVPQTAVFALLGGGVSVERSWQVALGALLFAVSAGIGMMMLRRHRAGRAMQSAE